MNLEQFLMIKQAGGNLINKRLGQLVKYKTHPEKGLRGMNTVASKVSQPGYPRLPNNKELLEGKHLYMAGVRDKSLNAGRRFTPDIDEVGYWEQNKHLDPLIALTEGTYRTNTNNMHNLTGLSYGTSARINSKGDLINQLADKIDNINRNNKYGLTITDKY